MLTLFISLISATQLWAMPKAVILLRHGEKPASEVDTNLSARGFERAQQLPRIFKENKRLKEIGKPDFLFAAGVMKMTNALRSIETLKPLAQELNLPLNHDYVRDAYHALIRDLKKPEYDNKVVVICWEHKLLKYFVKGLGLDDKKYKYPGNAFDRIWLITFKDPAHPVLEDMPQKILEGDSKK